VRVLHIIYVQRRGVSWRPEFTAAVPEVWVNNGLRFSTQEEAEANVLDLAIRYSAVQDWRVVECDERANFRYCGAGLRASSKMG
jgi:hypothetical protein